MDQVSMLGVLQTQQRPVRRQSALKEPAEIDAADADRLGRPVDLLCRASVERDVDGEPVAIADSRSDYARCLRQSLAPAVRNPFQKGSGLPSEEGLYAPATRLVPGLVLETTRFLLRRGWAFRRSSRRGCRSPCGVRPSPGPRRAPARCRARWTRRRSVRAHEETTPGERRPASGRCTPGIWPRVPTAG